MKSHTGSDGMQTAVTSVDPTVKYAGVMTVAAIVALVVIRAVLEHK